MAEKLWFAELSDLTVVFLFSERLWKVYWLLVTVAVLSAKKVTATHLEPPSIFAMRKAMEGTCS